MWRKTGGKGRKEKYSIGELLYGLYFQPPGAEKKEIIFALLFGFRKTRLAAGETRRRLSLAEGGQKQQQKDKRQNKDKNKEGKNRHRLSLAVGK